MVPEGLEHVLPYQSGLLDHEWMRIGLGGKGLRAELYSKERVYSHLHDYLFIMMT